jgi:hypothetical protein
MEHEAGKGDEVQARQCLGQTLVVACQAAEARGPGEAALDHSAAGKQDEAALGSDGLGQLDDLQADAVCSRRLGGRLASLSARMRLSPEDSLLLPCRRTSGAADQLATTIGADRRHLVRTACTEGALVRADVGFIGWSKRRSTALAHASHL